MGLLNHEFQFSFTQEVCTMGLLGTVTVINRTVFCSPLSCWFLLSILFLLRILGGKDEKCDSGMKNLPQTLTLQTTQVDSKIPHPLGSILFVVGFWSSDHLQLFTFNYFLLLQGMTTGSQGGVFQTISVSPSYLSDTGQLNFPIPSFLRPCGNLPAIRPTFHYSLSH